MEWLPFQTVLLPCRPTMWEPDPEARNVIWGVYIHSERILTRLDKSTLRIQVESHFPKEMLHNILGIPRYLKFLGKASHTDHNISGSQHYSEPSCELVLACFY